MIRDMGLDCEIFLLNPISKVQHRLPSFNTIGDFSRFKRKLETEGRQRSAALDFLNKLELYIYVRCQFRTLYGCNCFQGYSTLALNRPGDERWTILLELPGRETKNFFDDILFSSGALHACVRYTSKDKAILMSVEDRTLNFGDQVMELKLVHFVDDRRGRYIPRLLESNNEVLFVIQILDELDDGDVEDYGYHGEGNDHDDIDGDVDEYYLADEATVVAEHDNENVNDLEGNHQDRQFDHEDEDHMLIKRM